MEIVSSKKIDMVQYGYLNPCHVYCIHVKISDVSVSVKEMIEGISDTSWINQLNTVGKITFEATSQRTIHELVTNILNKVENEPTKEAGEYMVSYNAQKALHEEHLHVKVPLAELLKEKVTGNPGFDFHTESGMNHVIFGEAKYSANDTPRAKALDQISSFINLKKDDAELNILEHFVSGTAITNFSNKKKGYVAAFSLNASSVETIFKNALKSEVVGQLISHQELYLVAIEI